MTYQIGQSTMLTDYDAIKRLREVIKYDRPTELCSKDGVRIGTVHYGCDPEGCNYADIGWILPEGCVVVLEGHTNIDNATTGVPVALRFWLD